MLPETRFAVPLAAALLATAVLTGCAAPAPPAVAVPVAVVVEPAPAPPEFAPIVITLPETPVRGADLAAAVIDYADRVRNLAPVALVQEIGRLGDPGDGPADTMQLAIALSLTRQPVNVARAQGLLQGVLNRTDAQALALQPLARLLAAQLAQQVDLRRLEEQADRQNQVVRDAQRRIEQLNDRLEAVRAIERSLPSRQPGNTTSGNGPRP